MSFFSSSVRFFSTSFFSHSSGNRDSERVDFDDAFEIGGEHAIVAVEIFLVLHEAGAREVIEILDAPESDLFLQRFDERQELADRDRHAALFQLSEKTQSTRWFTSAGCND